MFRKGSANEAARRDIKERRAQTRPKSGAYYVPVTETDGEMGFNLFVTDSDAAIASTWTGEMDWEVATVDLATDSVVNIMEEALALGNMGEFDQSMINAVGLQFDLASEIQNSVEIWNQNYE